MSIAVILDIINMLKTKKNIWWIALILDVTNKVENTVENYLYACLYISIFLSKGCTLSMETPIEETYGNGSGDHSNKRPIITKKTLKVEPY